jgi:hypothetical protein
MKVLTGITVAVAMLVLTGPAMAQWTETFESYGAGTQLPDPPWSKCCNNQAGGEPTVYAGLGFGGSQGASHQTSGSWGEVERATGLAPNTAFVHTYQHYRDSTDTGLTRMNAFLSTNGSGGNNNINIYEEDGGNYTVEFKDSGGTNDFTVSFARSADTWYEHRITGTPAVGGWTMSHETRTWGGASWGAWNVDMAPTFWDESTYQPNWVGIVQIGLSGNSNFDNISIIPEPATMALLGIGGLMVLRRRRAA